MSLPKKLYRLVVIPGGKPLAYRQRGGGTFSTLRDMQYRTDDLDRAGVLYKIYETETNWKEVTDHGEKDSESAGGW